MRILQPNTGEDIVPVVKTNIFVSITDYSLISLLKEIVVAPGQHHWEWIGLNLRKPIDVSRIGNRFSTFDNTLNKVVNDPYCTVYEFEEMEDLILDWKSIKYVDNIKTIYKTDELDFNDI